MGDSASFRFQQRHKGPLYKYRSLRRPQLQRTERLFTRREVYYARREQLNDPFDCRFTITFEGNEAEYRAYVDRKFPEEPPQERAKLAARYLHMRDTRRQELESTFSGQLKEFLNTSLGVLSLAERANDVLMWSHYADAHRGICVGFWHDDIPSFVTTAYRVRYRQRLPVVPVVTGDDVMEKFLSILLSKASFWEYEREWRDVRTAEGPGVERFPDGLLSEVILGALITEENRRMVMNWIRAMGTRPRVFQASLHETDYGITVAPIG